MAQQQPVQNLFVYGTLRKGFDNETFSYIDPYVSLLGKASVKGDCFLFNELPALVQKEMKQTISGILYRINDPEAVSWVLMQLDDLKGMRPDNSEIPLYKRTLTKIFFNGEELDAWIYLFNADVAGLPMLASDDISKLLNDQKGG